MQRSFGNRAAIDARPRNLPRAVVCAALATLWLWSPAIAQQAKTVDVEVKAPEVKIQGQSPADKIDARILAEATKGSEIMANLTYLSDMIGARLTGSAALKRANDWAAGRMKAYGLENVQLEPWTIPEGWERGTAYARILEPDIGRTLALASQAWAPGTNGKIQGEVVTLGGLDAKELAALKGKLKGAIILDGAPKALKPLPETLADIAAGKNTGMGGRGFKGKGDKSFEEMRAIAQQRSELMQKEGVACILKDAGKHNGLLFTTGSWGGRDGARSNKLPTAYVAHNHYELLYRLAKRKEGTTKLEIEITNKSIPGPVAVYNTVGEIKGSEKPDEFVVVGAHLDSWDLGQGTTDNGTGSMVVLETARILKQCGIQPKRTIRFCLFTGEEQGLHGSKVYCDKHKDDIAKTSVCLVHDTGPGKVTGIGMGSFPAARELLEKELTNLKALGVTDFAARSMGGSDHMSFASKGVPGFIMKQNTTEYFLFTHHSQADTLEAARPREADLIQGAQVMAMTAMRIANLNELLPRAKAQK